MGNGAAGLVRKAGAEDGKATYAVKFLAPDPKYIDESAFDDVAQRFKREGARGAKLRHHHLVEVLAYCENADSSAFLSGGPSNPFILMEYIKGKALESYVRKTTDRGRFLVTRPRLGIAIQIASALNFLRKKKLTHRDVKPANVFLSKIKPSSKCWNARLGDFGIMKWGDFHASVATGTLTVTSQSGLGTLKYMAPEQATKPKDVTVKADVYSLGITLYELFTGQILASPHHVYEIANARRSRGNTSSRFLTLGCPLGMNDGDLAGLVLEMFLAPSGRPSIEKVLGRLEWEYEARFGNDWEEDLY